MKSFAVSAIGRDKPGIVAAVTKVLLGHALNIEDAQATILRGHFTLTMVVSGGDHTDEGDLQAALDTVRERLGLEACVAREINVLPTLEELQPTHVVTVLGLDRPGIVYAVCQTLADAGVSILDLNSRLTYDDVYAMMLEVAVEDPNGLDRALQSIAKSTEIDVSLRPRLGGTLAQRARFPVRVFAQRAKPAAR